MSSGSVVSATASAVGATTSSARGGTTVAMVRSARVRMCALGIAQIAHVERLADDQQGDVELDPVGNVFGEHLDLDFAGDLVEHAAGVAHAVRGAHEVHRNLEPDLLVRVDFVEIDVDDVGADRVPLNLANQGLESSSRRP